MLLSFLGLKASGLRRSQTFFILLKRFFRHSFKNIHRFLIACLLLIGFFVLLSNRQNPYLQNCQHWLSDLTVTGLYYLQAPFAFIKNYCQTHTNLQQQVHTLALENQRLQLLHHQTLMYQRENEHLRRLLNALPSYGHEVLTVKVLGLPTDSVSTLAVEARPDINLLKNQVVIGSQGVVGRLYQVGKTTARVLLITDSRSRIPARIATTGDHVILAGQNSSELKVLHAAAPASTPDHQPKIGDLLVTSGFGGIYPPGLPIARISSITEGSFTADILIDSRYLEYVSILKTVIPQDDTSDESNP